jgi:hypothetical protein
MIGGLATTGLATGVAAALVIGPTARVAGTPPPAQANAATILLRASKVALTQPALKPRPDQYVYLESTARQGRLPGQPGGTNHRRVWLSADGRHAGLLLNYGTAGEQKRTWLCDDLPDAGKYKFLGKDGRPRVDLANPPRGCRSTAASRNDLPTDAAAMRTWLYRNTKGGNPPDVQAFVTVGDTIRESYVPPAALSAMFAAAAKLPGVTVTKGAVDSAGRKGTAIGQTWHGIRQELIFDARTYRLLGERQVVDYDNSFRPKGGKHPDTGPWTPDPKMRQTMKEGTVLYSTATLRIAVADAAGQVPTG